jgi:anti-sigma28 factor (negative regulator of flagellin synthesis)
MKIEGQRPSFDPSLNRLDQKKAAETATADGVKVRGDKIRVSAEAQLASEAVKQAVASADVRPEVVARAKQLLDAGLVGNNANVIADALIKSALES